MRGCACDERHASGRLSAGDVANAFEDPAAFGLGGKNGCAQIPGRDLFPLADDFRVNRGAVAGSNAEVRLQYCLALPGVIQKLSFRLYEIPEKAF